MRAGRWRRAGQHEGGWAWPGGGGSAWAFIGARALFPSHRQKRVPRGRGLWCGDGARAPFRPRPTRALGSASRVTSPVSREVAALRGSALAGGVFFSSFFFFPFFTLFLSFFLLPLPVSSSFLPFSLFLFFLSFSLLFSFLFLFYLFPFFSFFFLYLLPFYYS